MTNYIQGQLVRIQATLLDLNSALIDPTTVIFSTRTMSTIPPVSTVKTYPSDVEVVRESTGVFHMDVTLSTSGVLNWRVEGTGLAPNAKQDSVYVMPTNQS